jgi:hypothetical protein
MYQIGLGGNSPVFATFFFLRYGQTGSGKTFTMMGPPKRQVEIQGFGPLQGDPVWNGGFHEINISLW